MSKEIDITGKRFGRLVAIKKIESKISGTQKRSSWLFKCDCGNYIETIKYSVMRGSTTSCGCYLKDVVKKTHKKHGMESTRLYQCWLDMKHRCYLKSVKKYKIYGGRGITVCDEWTDKEKGSTNFINWALSNGYSDNLTLDRIDVNGNYCPENCKWSTAEQQQNNRKNNHRITINGETKTLQQWLNSVKITANAFYYRKNVLKWDDEKAIMSPRLRYHSA